MFKHTITRVRPSVDVEWPQKTTNQIYITEKYELESTISVVESDDRLTRSISRTSSNSAVFTSIESDLANTSSDLYWITQHGINNNIITTFALEEI